MAMHALASSGRVTDAFVSQVCEHTKLICVIACLRSTAIDVATTHYYIASIRLLRGVTGPSREFIATPAHQRTSSSLEISSTCWYAPTSMSLRSWRRDNVRDKAKVADTEEGMDLGYRYSEAVAAWCSSLQAKIAKNNSAEAAIYAASTLHAKQQQFCALTMTA